MKTEIKYGNFTFDSASGYPVPNFSIAVDNTRTSAGDYLSSEMIVSLEGVVYARRMNSHDSTTVTGDTTITTLFSKASGLKQNILINDQKNISIICGTNKAVDQTGTVRSITFSENENHWASSINYKIEIAVPRTGSLFTKGLTNYQHFHVSNVQDDYRVEVMDDQFYRVDDTTYLPTYRISRTISAVGKAVDASGALLNAKKWVSRRETSHSLTGIFATGEFPLYNPTRNISISEIDGSYTITDTFISKSGNPWIDSRTISVNIDANGYRQVEINGRVQGLQPVTLNYPINLSTISGRQDIIPTTTGITQYKYQNALSGYYNITGSIYNNAKAYISSAPTGGSVVNTHGLHPLPTNVTEGFNPTEGSISYTRTYNTRPLSLVTGALTETISIRESRPVEAYTEIFVIGRSLGPVIRYTTGKPGVGVKTVSYEGVFPRPTGLKKYAFPFVIKQAVDRFVSGEKPADKAVIKEDTETLNLTENRLSRTISWEYTDC